MNRTIIPASLMILTAAAVLAAGALTFAPRDAQANQAMAQKTGKGCPTCHTAPPALNGTGKKFKETGKL